MGLGSTLKRLIGSTPKPNATFAPTLSEWIDATVTPADLARRYGPLPKAVQLLKYFVSCTEASTCAALKAKYLAQFQPRMYRRGGADRPNGFDLKQVRTTKAMRKRLKDANPERGVGSVAGYAANAGKDIYEVVDHPFLRLYRQPNPFETAALYWEMDHLQRQIFGNSYAAVFYGDNGEPTELRHMAGQNIRIVPSKENMIESFEYKVQGNPPSYYTPDSVVHLKYATSYVDYFYGQSWMERCIIDMDLLISAKVVEKYRFDNGMRAEFAVLMPEYNPVQRNAVREEIDMRGVGVRRAGGYLIMPGASTIIPLTMNNRDAQYSEGMKRAAETIRFCAGVPEAMAAINNSNLAGGLLADGIFKQITIQPELCNNAQQLTALCNRLYGHQEGDVWIAYDDIIDVGAEENEKATVAVWTTNLLTLNEARERIKADPIDDERGNMLYSELAAPAPVSGSPEEEALTPVNEPKKSDAKPAQPPEQGTDKVKSAEPTAPPTPPSPSPVVVSVRAMHDSHKMKSGSWEYPFSREAYNRVMKGVEAWWKAGVEAAQFDAAKLQAGLEPIKNVFQEGGQDGIAQVLELPGGEKLIASSGVSFDLLSPDVVAFVESYTIRLANEITAEKNADLTQAILNSVKEGMTTNEAMAEVKKVMTEATDFECERIARTESTRAYGDGNIQSWTKAGVQQKQWRQAGGPCPLCAAIAKQYSQPVPLDHVFYQLGDSIEADGKRYVFDYEAITRQPAHPSCRCVCVPVLGAKT
jgi:HK97 family phage portal protein